MRASTIESVFLTRPLGPVDPSSRVLVLGGDAIGFHVAQRLAEEGFGVTLLGPPADVELHEGVTPLTGTTLEELRGHVGRFEAVLRHSTGRAVEPVGFVVAAQPGEMVPKFEEYGLTRSDTVLALSDLEILLRDSSTLPARRGDWFHVAFLVGLEGGSDPAVLAHALSAIDSLQKMDKVQAYVFTRQVKVAASGMERRYRACRENGTLFFKFDEAGPTFQDGPEGTVMVFKDPLLGNELELIPDLLVVDEYVRPPASLKPLLDITPLSRLSAPFLQPESTRFSGAQTPRAGILGIGPSRGTLDPDVIESEVEAVVVALKEWSHEDHREALPGPPEVDAAKCAMCLTCVRLCPHGAMSFHTVAAADPASCVRCGICAVECPMGAITLPPCTGETEMDSRIRLGLAAAGGSRKILAFICSRSAHQALETVSAGIREKLIPVVVPCAGTIAVSHMIAAIRYGADAVMAAGCFTGNCASGYGTVLAAERAARTREILSQAGMNPELVRFVPTAGNTPAALITAVREMETAIAGPIPDGE